MERHVILLKEFMDLSDGKTKRRMGIFQCPDCPSFFVTRAERLNVMSGRCLPCSNKIGGKSRKTHGFNNTNSRLHVTWSNMKRRCLNPSKSEIEKYAGVTLCDEWRRFEPFMQWSLDNGYTDMMTIDRIDGSKGYEPGNCRYVDHSVQAANRRMTDKNKSGHVGVSWSKGKWIAKVQWRRKQIHLGRYSDINDAIKARNDYIELHNLPHTKA